MQFQQSEATAAQRRFPVYLVDVTDGITPEDGENGGQPQVSENGAAFANTSGVLVFLAEGFYYVELTAAELGTLGMLTIRYKSANTVEFNLTGQVVAFDPYAAYALASVATETRLAELDAGNLPTDIANVQSDTDDIQTRLPAALSGGRMDSDVGALGGVVQSLTDLKDFADDGYDPATDKVQGVVLVDTTTANSDMRGTENAALASVLGALADAASDGDPTATDTLMQYMKQLINILIGTTGIVAFPASAAPANGVSLAEVIRSIYDDSNSLDGTKIPDVLSLANINAEVDTALVDARLDELVSATAGGVDAVVGSLLDLIMNADGGQTFSQASDSLEAIANAIAGLNDLAQADILNDATPFPGASITEARQAELDAANLPTDIANIQADTDNIQTRIPAALVGGAMDSDVSNMQTDVVDANALAADAVDEIVDQTWDELIAGHLGAGSTGAALNGASAPTVGQIADAVWDEAKAGHVAGGSFGEEVQLHSLSTEIAALNDLSQADILNDATPFPGGNIDAAISTRAIAGDAMDLIANAVDSGALDITAGQEIADRILARAIASGADGGRTIQDALRAIRNRRAIVAGTLTIYEEDDATPAWTGVVTTAAGDPITEIDPA